MMRHEHLHALSVRWTYLNVSDLSMKKEVACTPADTLPDLEPLLTESKRRFVLFPIQYPEVRTVHHIRITIN